jgi:hypothetical protein
MANRIAAKRRLITCPVGLAGVLVGTSGSSMAHHGVAGLGAAGLRGPGAPIEAATSATLPAGETLAYLKLDHAKYETYDADPSKPESDYANYWMAGLGYGLTPWFSAYVFLPYHSKVDERGGFDTHGFADISLFGQLGFKYDDRWQLRRFLSNDIPVYWSFRPSSLSRQQLHSPAMRLLPLLEDERKSGAPRYIIFRQSPKT